MLVFASVPSVTSSDEVLLSYIKKIYTEVGLCNSEVKMRRKVVCMLALLPVLPVPVFVYVYITVCGSLYSILCFLRNTAQKGTIYTPENYSTLPSYLPTSEFLDLGT